MCSLVCNLHPSLTLTPALVSLLDKGLNFIPTPHSNPPISSFAPNIKEFIRKLQWSAFFNFQSNHQNKPFSKSLHSLPPASKIPKPILDLCSTLTSLLNPTDQQQQQYTHKLKHSNLTRAETTALKQLKSNSSIILKPADKGGKIVLQHRDNYKFEALRQLNDTNFYKPLSAPIYLQTAALIKRTVKNMLYQGFISKSQHRFLTPPVNPRPRHFYTLPKIHKTNDKWTIPDILPPGRPIVSGCNSESAAVEHFIDFHLQPIATSIPSFIRDSSHFKSLLNDLHINDSDILFTLDVESLYSNIPIQQGLTSVKKALSEHPSKDRPDNYLLTLLEITLLRNDFQFDNKTFLQIKGTAMGKKYAPSFANIFMHYWEQHALSTTHFTPFFWKRYIDDIFGIWQHSETQLHNFLQHLNSINPHIKVTLTSSSSCIDFLDCTVFKSNNHVATKIYSKPTDSHRLLHFNSFHPRHVFESIVKAQILRFIKLSSHPKDFLASYRTLKSSLLHCGYSRSLIKNCKKWALFTTNCNPSTMVTGCKPCLTSNCKLCPFIRSSCTISKNLNHQMYPISQNTSCKTRNCIYALHCTRCTHIPTLYIGETKNACHIRFSQHKHNILSHHDSAISNHFNQPDHNISMLQVSILQSFNVKHKCPTKSDLIRKKAELHWIHKLQTHTPIGLNTVTHLNSTDIPLILKFSKSASHLAKLVKTTLNSASPHTDNISITTCFSNNKNLKQILTRSKFS